VLQIAVLEFDVGISVERTEDVAHVVSMSTQTLPPANVMLAAFLERDASYDGIFLTGVRTTGIFCRPTCSAKKPLPENIDFFPSSGDALHAGFRPCNRCRPMELSGTPPEWLRGLLAAVEVDPSRRWSEQDVRAAGLSPERVRRWFKQHHGMTFHAYSRARRLGTALGQVKKGSQVGRAAFDVGYESLSGFQEAFHRYFGSSPTTIDDATVIRVDRLATPLGPMLVAATDEALCLLEFVDRRALPTQISRIRAGLHAVFVPDRNAIIEQAAEEVSAYFSGALRDFMVPIVAPGTEFQRTVWRALAEIPYGVTRSYAELAQSIGNPKAVRAVGRSNGLNALAIIVPCHRVVGADGRLVGYGGGLWRKQKLLELETI
jgi:AraC family transcriptional regulator, regulatory protein of adaptative response / methylated-DNA-[protein]-cysteine methyltransferase